jgi:3-oxoadipate enol-lactonase
MATLQVEDDIALQYEVSGTGPPLLNISGSGGDLRNPSVVRARLGEHFTVASWDQRGLGQSSRPDRRFTMADYASDAVAVMDHLNWDSCSVAGASFGGMVAQELAVTHPQRIERLVLMCTSTGGAGGSSYPLHELPDLPAEELARFHIAIVDTRRDAQWQAAHPERTSKILAETARMRAVGADEPGRSDGYQRQLEARAGHDVHNRLADITIPTLVQGGKFDNQAPPKNQLALVMQVKGARLQMYEGGHMFTIQDKAALADAVDFLLG